MRPFAVILVALVAAVAASPVRGPTRPRNTASASAGAYPGDAFLRALDKTSAPKFAVKIGLGAPSATTRRHLSQFRDAALAENINVTQPVDFLDETRQFKYPSFDHNKCQLSKDGNGVVPFVASTTLGTYFENIFQMIPTWTKGAIKLSRFDLFHGHLFANPATKSAGVVFHAKEYPADNTADFPYDLGFCQVDSNLNFVEKVMRKRNLVWTMDSSDKISLWWIDMGVKTGDQAVDGVLGGEPFYTLFEDTLGHVIADFYYLEGSELGISLY
ncbi:hypothetical protein H072_2898 [Dactylellina haptotyla CBS 200.50]|uniref:Peptidase A1 domain-containing protein n=1 Tax=Dactylellina haptotyla (strain CBS 200.50) TaxID=1284197 RepID=S8C600_DACHA|nr:hypothetical protein H072_2898 [Dactylellina haptotyla CBS 200.50]